MKKTLIALAVAGAAVATGVNAGELYNQDGTSLTMKGRVEGILALRDGEASDESRTRLGFLGKQEINDNLYGVGYFEGQFTSNDNGDNDTEDSTSTFTDRYTYAGLGGTYGEVTYGKQDGVFTPLSDFTDILSYHGDSAVNKLDALDRIDNQLKYAGSFDALSVYAEYRFADRVENAGTYNNNDQDAYGLSAIYSLSDIGLDFGLGYGEQNDDGQWVATVAYTLNDLYLSALYSHIDYDAAGRDNYDGYEFVASYTVDKTKLIASYNYGETSDTAVDNLALEVAYYFQPNFRSYVSYNFNMLDQGDTYESLSTGSTTTVSDADEQDELVVGLRYDF
ncbi:porin [Vibrio mangrovi]|uniref:Porin n=1 Tax=Vibrio mangrovi TaxID=474394 RepID=A0A1Y6IXT5_9VIBR|nr:porin [Vibrio mangrovi]MDW6003060.1 porin [Vibrio mangrovi]SMS01302.1 Porin-like protein L precursor [Vibrio mangrovi]